MKSRELINTLLNSRKLRSKEDVYSFDHALSAIGNDINDEDIQKLYEVFDDNAYYQEVMWGLVHYIESLDVERSMVGMFNSYDLLTERGIEWCKNIHYRIFNDNAATSIYSKILGRMNEELKEKWSIFLKDIVKEVPEHRNKINQILISI
jgi:hypothetical protein